MNVHQHDVGPCRAVHHEIQRGLTVVDDADHFEAGIGAEQMHEQRAHDHRVFRNQHLDPLFTHACVLRQPAQRLQ